MKYAIVTFGCRVNQADSLALEEQLLAAGASPASTDAADVVLVNSCSVTSGADQGVRQVIRRIARTNPSARVVVTGCYATRRPDEIRALPGVSTVVPNDDKPQLLAIAGLARAPRGSGADRHLTTAERFGTADGSCGAPVAIEPGLGGRTAFTLRVQTGCAETCSYCIIPTTRGAPRSRRRAEVIAEVERIAAAGFKEIVLAGVHLGSYGRDLLPVERLTDLLAALDSLPLREEIRFRISSLEPMDCTPAIIALVAARRRFAPHFHLPLQHASNRMLAAMRRPYTLEFYSGLVDRIRTLLPDASMGTDVIVGFPGETADDFDQLVSYLEGSPLTHVHVFPYSDREGTAAAGLRASRVPGPTVRERGRRVREVASRLSARFLDSQRGSMRQALTIEDGSIAVTDNFLKVRVPPGHHRNEWVTVEVGSSGEAFH
jgi:threonylcarbamoyladenosine tRNA methylthiotransferase MtaB